MSKLARWRLAIQVAAMVAAIVALKVVIEVTAVSFIDLSPLFTSVVAGGVFLIGLLVAGTLADYKEAERMPSQLAASLEAIHEDGVSVKFSKDGFDLERLRKRLLGVVTALRHDLTQPGFRSSLAAINELTASYVELEGLEAPTHYVDRMKKWQAAMRESVLRMSHIERTQFLPSARILIQTVVGLIVVVMLFTDLGPTLQSAVVIGFISYFFIYLVRLLGVLDTPFRVQDMTSDDVSLFLLDEFADRMRQSSPIGDGRPEPTARMERFRGL